MRKEQHLTVVLASIGANLRTLRLRHEFTQEELAEAADIDLRFLQRVERGQTNVSVAVLVALADVLAVAPASLFRAAQLEPVRRGRPPKR